MDDKLDSILAALGSVQRSQADLHHEVGPLRGEVGLLRGEVGHLREEVSHLRGHVSAAVDKVRADLRADLIATRTQVMERLDRQQAKLESMFNDIGVSWHSSERVERKVEADREEIRSLARMVSELTRMMRALESRLSIVEEKP